MSIVDDNHHQHGGRWHSHLDGHQRHDHDDFPEPEAWQDRHEVVVPGPCTLDRAFDGEAEPQRRELLLRDGRRPLVLFGDPPPIVEETRSVLFDDHRHYDVRYRFCDEDHRAAFLRQEVAWGPGTSR